MVDVVSTIGGGSQTAAFSSQPVVAPSTTTTPSNPAGLTAQDTSKTTHAAALGSSNRLYADPVSGTIVAQEINADGQISSQIPQSFVLAYLRDGLDSNGLPKTIDQVS